MSEQSDTPDTPPEVLARQSKSRALTPQTAELIGSKEYVDDFGKTVGGAEQVSAAAAKASRDARTRAEKYMGGTPHAGLSIAKVSAIKAKDYPAAPKMDVEMGDRTPAFVNWLWAVHPADAKVRYFPRCNVWPAVLPVEWPPAQAEARAPRAKTTARAATRAASSTPASATAAS